MRYLLGIIGFALGIIIIVYRERIKRVTGDFGFAEKYLGPGGTYSAFVLLGIIVSIGSLMYMFGTLQTIIQSMFGPFFGGSAT